MWPRRPTPIAILIVLAAVVIAASTAWARVQTPASGISGHVYAGPLEPIRHALPGFDGDEEPYSATLVVRSADSSAVLATVRSDQKGAFSVPLAPGMYVVVPMPEQTPFPAARPMRVAVSRDRFTDILVLYDTWAR